MSKARYTAAACRLAVAVSMLAGGGWQAAHAQEATSASDASLSNNTIIVTARRRDENLQDVPIAITAVGSQTIEDLGISDVQDLEAIEPTLSVSPSSGYVNKPVFGLRGIRPAESIYGQDPTVAVYFADVVQSPAQGSNLGMYDLENIQVLKGPQGTLFGRNTVGGAILLTPRKPGDSFGIDAMFGAGSFGLIEAELGIDLPITPSMRLRLAGRMIDSDGYQTNVADNDLNGTKYGGEETKSIRATLVGDLTDRIENTIVATYDRRKANGRMQVLQAINPSNSLIGAYTFFFGTGFFDALERAEGRDIHDVETDIDNYDNVEAWSITNSTVAELSDTLTLKSILNYREVDSYVQIDLDSSPIRRILTSEDQYAYLNHYSAELQLQGDTDRFDWVLGGFYYHEEGVEFSPGYFFEMIIPAINPIEQGARADNTSYSVFAQGSYELTDQLTLTAGARMNWDKKKLTITTPGGRECALYTQNPENCGIPLSESFSQPTGTLSLDYQATPDLLFYVTSRLGYRSGGFNLRGSDANELVAFEPETVIDVEGGMKATYDVGGMRMRTNVAIYNQWYDDIQRTVAVQRVNGSPGSAVQNAAKATVFGIEFNQMVQPVEPLTFDVSYAYTKPKYKDYTDPFTMADLSETPFHFTPRHSVSIRGTFEQDLGDAGTFRLVGNAAWQDDVWIHPLHTSVTIAQHPADLIPLLKQEAFWLANVSATLEDIGGTGLALQGYVKNLFDKEYKLGGIQLYTGATGFISAAYGRPREAGVQLRYSF